MSEFCQNFNAGEMHSVHAVYMYILSMTFMTFGWTPLIMVGLSPYFYGRLYW
jgi:hypothetical protein